MPWTKPAVRETIKKYLRVCRAHEELDRCNIEICRVFTSIRDEGRKFDGVIRRLKDQKSSILGPVIDFCTRRRRVNSLLSGHIQQIFNLDGYTGSRSAGRKQGSCMEGGRDTGDTAYENHDFGGEDGEEIDDGEMNLVDGLLDFVTKL